LKGMGAVRVRVSNLMKGTFRKVTITLGKCPLPAEIKQNDR